MKQLDADTLLKEKVIDRMRATQQAGATPVVLDGVAFRRLVHETREEQERIRLGLAAAPEPAPAPHPKQAPKPYTSPHEAQVAPGTRAFERAITGKIVNLGSLASVGRSMDMYFETDDPQGFGFVGVTIDWYASPMGEPTNHVRQGRTSYLAHHKPEKWSVSFGKPGKYEITARVDHQRYWPTTFKSFLEIKTEDERLSEVEQHALGAFDDQTKVTEPSHFFEVSFTNDRFGPNKYTFGTIREGELPDDWTPQTLDQRLGFMKRDRDALHKLIALHEVKPGKASQDLVAYAEHALETMQATEDRIQGDAKELLSVRGARARF